MEGLADKIGVELAENDPEPRIRIQPGADLTEGGILSW